MWFTEEYFVICGFIVFVFRDLYFNISLSYLTLSFIIFYPEYRIRLIKHFKWYFLYQSFIIYTFAASFYFIYSLFS
ncbi:hypothetical protein B0E34_11685 [Chryseobacterium mucoviscidosis]|uniref:Uncharacterized protein n=1 Tax=Chryseobacterium mucoviscidosis TaxID=1945581 RepID=A0A202BZU4_9FLAO|nr:hypothetical protein B0E34_11685 [Chryseobacterium mucoviscidosis]